MSVERITRFEGHGPEGTGMVEWDPIDPADLESGEPVQRGHEYYTDESIGLHIGVWDCTPMVNSEPPRGTMVTEPSRTYMNSLTG